LYSAFAEHENVWHQQRRCLWRLCLSVARIRRPRHRDVIVHPISRLQQQQLQASTGFSWSTRHVLPSEVVRRSWLGYGRSASSGTYRPCVVLRRAGRLADCSR